MSYPGATTTDILPVTGSLSLSTIGTLSGIKISPTIGPDTAPYRLRDFRGQDFDIPTGNDPIKFSSLRGAINYKRNYHLYIARPNDFLTTGNIDTDDLYYRSQTDILRAPYGAKSLGSISSMLDIKIKGSSTNSADTFALTKGGVIVASWEGYINSQVTLWMQINNDTHPIISKASPLSISESLFVKKTKLADIITSLAASQNITIAPEILKNTLGELKLNPLTPVESTNIFTQNSGALLRRLALIFNAYTGIGYEIDIGQSKKTTVLLKVSSYNVGSFAPLCYAVGSVSASCQKLVSSACTIPLSKYPISSGSIIKFYMGPGPSNAKGGSVWGFQSGKNKSTKGMFLALGITNTLRLIYQ